MIVLMASGNASMFPGACLIRPEQSRPPLAAELGEVVFGSPHYRILFLIGVMLFIVTFLTNLTADIVMHRLKFKLEGKR